MSYQYIAFLRGINVGGKNIMKMADLRACLEQAGFERVETYIQSGNVLLESDSTDLEAITRKITSALKKQFGYTNPTLVLTGAAYARTVASAPTWVGKDPMHYKYDVIFLIPPLRPGKALAEMKTREGVDRVEKGFRSVFFSRRIAELSKSMLSTLTQSPIYQQVTVRNWNTTTKMLERLKARAT